MRRCRGGAYGGLCRGPCIRAVRYVERERFDGLVECVWRSSGLDTHRHPIGTEHHKTTIDKWRDVIAQSKLCPVRYCTSGSRLSAPEYGTVVRPDCHGTSWKQIDDAPCPDMASAPADHVSSRSDVPPSENIPVSDTLRHLRGFESKLCQRGAKQVRPRSFPNLGIRAEQYSNVIRLLTRAARGARRAGTSECRCLPAVRLVGACGRQAPPPPARQPRFTADRLGRGPARCAQRAAQGAHRLRSPQPHAST